MSGHRTLRLDQALDGAQARVVVQLGPQGAVSDAWFDLDGLPRVEPLLLGRPVAEVPAVIERLCGICPATHHLAGARALDALAGVNRTTPTSEAVRRLLHHGAVLQAHARPLAQVDADRARALHTFAQRVVVAASGGSRIPRCAVPGGVSAAVTQADRVTLSDQVAAALTSAADLVTQVEARLNRIPLETFPGHDVALVDESGALDLYGASLRAVAPDNTVVIAAASTAQWPELVAESRPGTCAPRPFLRAVGPARGGYRVGPVAQLRAASHLSTPIAEAARQRWTSAAGGVLWARAVVTLHTIEVIRDLLTRPELTEGPLVAPTAPTGTAGPPPIETVAVGWVDGPRGLLVHTYWADDTGKLKDAVITTPTVQNEVWLAALLSAAARSYAISAGSIAGRPSSALALAVEAAVRTADPCLPCASLPPGWMGLQLTVIDVQGGTVAGWNLNPELGKG